MLRHAFAAMLALAVSACGGSPPKHDHPHDQTTLFDHDCDEGAMNGATGQAGSGAMAPSGSTSSSPPAPSKPMTQDELDKQEKAIEHTGPGLAMGPSTPPCKQTSGPPAPVPPTEPTPPAPTPPAS